MEMELTDTERMLRDTFRDYFTRELEPLVPKMESGEVLPYELMRDMHRKLGLDAVLSGITGRGESRSKQDSAAGSEANTARYARTTFNVEMARISPSFTLSYGASVGLFGANVAGKGTPA
ncbi:MAG TPA: acyl-CoA dehydrogenase family protein, partial [Terriglobales bacterium]|nr:acyl-CoA dehydrogenase family protein [Terriglobales bacterium]